MIRTVDNKEVDRFDSIAEEWWDPKGKFRPLHQINPTRIAYIRDRILLHTGRDQSAVKPLSGLKILDIGCGGGLIAEPLTRLGASVTGLDPSPESIAAAHSHAERHGLRIEYLNGTSDDLVAEGRTFDCVLALEVIEHVPAAETFLTSCRDLLRPGGLLILSTLNRTAKSFALGIVAAEYLLGWLPRGTHQWNRFVTPNELTGKLGEVSLIPQDVKGMTFNPIEGSWSLSEDCGVNYFATATKAG